MTVKKTALFNPRKPKRMCYCMNCPPESLEEEEDEHR